MPKVGPDRIRNVAILGHSHEGKTTLAEAMLHASGAVPRMGSTDNGTAALDFSARAPHLTNQLYSDALRVFRPCFFCRAGDLPFCETGNIRTIADSCF